MLENEGHSDSLMSAMSRFYREDYLPTFEEEKKNRNFYMVFKAGGSQALRGLMKKSTNAAMLFLYLAENIDKSNAIVATGRVLSEELNIHETAISRAIKILVDERYVDRLKTGNTNIFVLNPKIIWSSWANGKDRCWFDNTKVLFSKAEQPQPIRRKMAVLMKKQSNINPEDIHKMIRPSTSEEFEATVDQIMKDREFFQAANEMLSNMQKELEAEKKRLKETKQKETK